MQRELAQVDRLSIAFGKNAPLCTDCFHDKLKELGVLEAIEEE